MATTSTLQNSKSPQSDRPHYLEPDPPLHEERLELSQLLALQNSVPFLRRLPLEQLVELWPYVQRKTYPSGTTLWGEDDLMDFIALIVSGQLRIEKVGGCKKTRFLLAEIGAGSWELSMMGGNENGTIVTTTEPTEILALQKEDLDNLLDTHPGLGVALLGEISRVLGIRLRKSSERLLEVL